jgi:hypothetical protein
MEMLKKKLNIFNVQHNGNAKKGQLFSMFSIIRGLYISQKMFFASQMGLLDSVV